MVVDLKGTRQQANAKNAATVANLFSIMTLDNHQSGVLFFAAA